MPNHCTNEQTARPPRRAAVEDGATRNRVAALEISHGCGG